MAKVMVTVQAPESPPSIEELRSQFALDADEIDEEFGVVEIDPEDHLYTILVEEEAAGKIVSTADWEVSGPYSNPRVEPFGPPERECD